MRLIGVTFAVIMAFGALSIANAQSFVESFEGGSGTSLTGWTFVNGEQTNKWFVGESTRYAGSKSCYISDNNGSDNKYNISSASTVHFYKDVTIRSTQENPAKILFYWKIMGESSTNDATRFYDYLAVYLIDANITPVAGALLNETAVKLNLGSTAWHEHVITLGVMNGPKRLIFTWHNDGSLGAQPPAAIDNIILINAPDDANINITEHPASVTYVPKGNSATLRVAATVTPSAGLTYQWYSSTTGSNVTGAMISNANAATYEVPSQTVGTLYYFCEIRAEGTSVGSASRRSNVARVNVCNSVSNETFETGSGVPLSLQNWTFVNGDQTNQWFIGTDTKSEGTKSCYISSNRSANMYDIARPSAVHFYTDILVESNLINRAVISFDWKSQGENNDYLCVYVIDPNVMPEAGTLLTQTPLAILRSGGTSWRNHVISLTETEKKVQRLVFSWINDGANGTQPPAAVDNIVLANAPIIPFKITSQPASLTNLTTGNITGSLSVGANGAEGKTLTYQWYSNTRNSISNSTAVPNGNSRNFSIPTELEPGTYYYYCAVNAGGEDATLLTDFAKVNVWGSNTSISIAEDFEKGNGAEIDGWVFVNDAQVNKWVIGKETANSGSKSCYISNNTYSHNYNVNSASVSHFYRDINIVSTVENPAKISFDWICQGESKVDGAQTIKHDYLRVYVVDTLFTPAAGNLMPQKALDTLAGSSTWQYREMTLPVMSGAKRLVFTWRNDNMIGTQPPAAVDNITVINATVMPVIKITAQPVDVVNVTAGSINDSISLTANVTMGKTISYQWHTINERGNQAIPGATTEKFTIPSESNAGTYYYFCKISADGAASVRSNIVTVTVWRSSITETDNISENFETGSGTALNGWVFVNDGQTNQWHIGTEVQKTGAKSCYISTDSSRNFYSINKASVVHFYRDINVFSTTSRPAELSFNWNAGGENSYDFLSVHIVEPSVTPTAGSVLNQGVLLAQCNLSANEWKSSNTQLPVMSGVRRLVFTWRNDGSAGTLPPAAVDNIILTNATTPVPIIIIASQPKNITIALSDSNQDSLFVAATATMGAKLSYQWYGNETGNNSGGTAVNGATSAIFAIPTTLTLGTHYYYCMVSASDGAAPLSSNVVSVTVAPTAILTPDRVVPQARPKEDAAVITPITVWVNEFTAGPNPVSKQGDVVNLFRRGSHIESGTLSVYDALGNLVRTISVRDNNATGIRSKRQVCSWDLRDQRGRPASAGAYLVSGVVKTADGKSEKVSVILNVR
jgi:plastocyanin